MEKQALSAKAVFDRALELESSAERESYLNQACATAPELRQKVAALLAAYQEVGSFMEAGPAGLAGTISQPADERAGTQIGPYKLLQVIGEGGMGTVFMAEQTQPVQRKVALKVIKAGMDSRQVIARFEAERQALAMMDHVNIARVLDAGATQSGRPYFVMELVHGVPITKYCDDHQLTPRQRLELFVPVCQAIQHAHQKGIIHRDVKPSNVMITLYDGKPVPKVIDFGVAKATEQKLTERTLFTQYGTMVGTLEYMSPEQAEMSALGVDTRSDIYSLGVLLYELLTGSTPLDRKRVREAAYAEILRMIKEDEPPKPSTRLSDSGEALASISAQRHMEPAKLTKLVRGDLDWIVMKALEKDRNRRYDTANGLAMDIQRYLVDEPVQACPPSAGYRLRKFVRRNKGPVLAASIVVLALVGGIVGTTWGLFRADAARQTAESREAETLAVLDLVQNKIFVAARPEGYVGALGREVTLRQAVEAALPFVDTSFKGQPLIEARLRMTLGYSFWYLGDFKIAAEQFGIARAIRVKQLGPDNLETLRSVSSLAMSYSGLGRNAEALKLHEEALSLRKATLGPDHPDTLSSMQSLAACYNTLGRNAEALKLEEETLALRKVTLGPHHPDTLWSMANLAVTYGRLGRREDALNLNEETLALRKAKLGPDHKETMWSMHNLAISYHGFRRYAEAIELKEQVVTYMKDKRGPDHPNALLAMASLAASYDGIGRRDDALKLREAVLEGRKARLGPDHAETLSSMFEVAVSYFHLGRYEDARKLDEVTLALQRAKRGTESRDTQGTMQTLSADYDALGRHADALALREELLELRKARLGPDHPNTLQTMQRVAESLVKLDRSAEALPIIEECLQRAAGKSAARQVIPDALQLRLQHYKKNQDVAGCRTTAEMWEKLNRGDPEFLYAAARMRAVTAGVIRARDKSEDAAKESAAEADRAMAWLKQALAAGYDNSAHMRTLLGSPAAQQHHDGAGYNNGGKMNEDEDLDALRDREDFKKLLAEVTVAPNS